MAKENSIIKMGDIIKANGEPIKCTVGENYFMKEEKLPTKETGLKISFMGSEKFTMIILFNWNVVLTSPILIFYKIIGSTMKECLSKIQKRDEEKLC